MNWKDTQCCGTCVHWDIDRVKTKSGAVLNTGAPCLCPIPELPLSTHTKTVHKSWMGRDTGAGCPLWKKREQVKQ